MAVKQNKLFRNTALVLILIVAFFMSEAVCLWEHEAKASEIGPELDHPVKPGGVEHEAVPYCPDSPDSQSQSEALTTTGASCRKLSETGLELDHPINHSGVEHEAVPHCPDSQSQSEVLTTTSASCRDLGERQSFQIHAQQTAKTGLEKSSFSDLIKWDSDVNWAEPCKIFLQNQSFLI